MGILIAVQIGDWKEEVQITQQRLELIENLKTDFQTKLERLDETIASIRQNDQELVAFLSVASTRNNHLSLDELKEMAQSGFQHEVFQPTLGAYDAAVATGAIGLLDSPLFNERVAEFQQHIGDFKRHDEISGHMMYLGSFWEVRKMLGSLHSIDDNPNNQFESPTYSLYDQEYRTFLAQPEVYAAFENMHWIYRDEYENLERAEESANEILAILDTL